MEIIRSNKGGEKVCYGDYAYTKKSTSRSTIRWECSKKIAFSCKGQILTDSPAQHILSFKSHNHPPDSAAIKCAKINQIMKGSKRGNTRQIALDAMAELTEEEKISLGEMESIKRRIRRYRSAGRPRDPSLLQELKIEDEWALTIGPNPQPFFIFDNGINARHRILIFGSEEGFRHLCHSDKWFMDGTFSTAPKLFEQLYIIRAPLGESAVSCIYALLTGKSQEIYEEMLQAILNKRDEYGLELNLNTTMSDFEQAIMNAIRNKLGADIRIKGCFYHLTQNIFRKIQNLGLASSYLNDSNIRHFCGMIHGLAFVPLNRVAEGMQFIRDNAPNELLGLIDYFDSTYVTGTYRRTGHSRQNGAPLRMHLRRIPPLFPPEIWNMHQITMNDENRTNNLCEGWNRGFKDLVGYSHPSIWTLLDSIRKDASVVSTQLTMNARGETLKRRVRKETMRQQKRIKNLCMDYLNGQKTLPETLQGIGHNIRLG